MRKSLVALVLLAVGLLLILLQLVGSVPDLLKTVGLHVQTPASYAFPEYDRALKSCVRGNLVDYKSLQQSGDLGAAVKALETISPDKLSNDEDKLPFWINAHNLLVLKNISDHYPIVDTRQLGQSTSMRRFIVGGKLYTIQDIEIDKLYPLATKYDALSVFLISNGARGGPPLLDHAIQPSAGKTEAEQAARAFATDPHNASLDETKTSFYISRYYKMVDRTLKRDYPNAFALVGSFLPEDMRMIIGLPGEKLRYFSEFDTRLNDCSQPIPQPRAQPPADTKEVQHAAP
jgi:hypothetical protein